ncbi:MAG: hypothetical protein WBL14_09160 [Caldicoprobacterales bacterium]
MAWQTPKTNWQAADVVRKDDFNRIEGNVQELQNTNAAHKADYATPHKYEDEGQDPNWSGVRYRLVMINGEPFMEVVEI